VTNIRENKLELIKKRE